MNFKEFVFFVCFVMVVRGYNLDVAHPLFYKASKSNEGKNEYFGMSVAIRPNAARFNGSWFVQVGAPKGRGSVYRCRFHGPCRPYTLDSEASLSLVGDEGVGAFKEKKDEAWIGVSMDIKRFGDIERSIVCGHRWINENLKNAENIDITFLMTGICYMQYLYHETFESRNFKLLPLVNADKIYTPKPYIPNLSTYHWGLGQAGTSVYLMENSSDIIIGAPGVTHWIGSVIRYHPKFNYTVANFAQSDIPRNKRYIYLGYAIAAGNFYKDKEIWFAVGAPRSANYRGEVFIFKYKDSTGGVRVETALKGTSFGEYFGSSLIAEDVNGDGYDDLIVGAPNFSKRHPDEGRIYVYLGTSKGRFLSESQGVNGRVGWGKFGSCMASLKDTDRDGFNDVIVAAPYEDDRKGVLYVYRGFPSGLLVRHALRIPARDLNPHLRGFGISISAGVDVDGNKFEDVIVGSYISQDVVLLRSRPIVILHLEIKTGNESFLDRRLSFFNMSCCFWYSGSDPPPYADVRRSVELDPLYNRVFIQDDNFTFLSSKTSIRLRLNELHCETYTLHLNTSSKNYFPLQIILKSELSECTKRADVGDSDVFENRAEPAKRPDTFSKWCPVGARAEFSKEIPFAGICGTDSICLSDLRMSCVVPEFLNGVYVLGSSDDFQLFVRLVNFGEPSLEANLKIWSNLGLTWKEDGLPNPVEFPQKVFRPKINGFISDDFQANYTFKIPFEKVLNLNTTRAEEKRKLIVEAEIETANPDIDLSDNRCNLTVRLVSDSVVFFRSSSSLSKYYGTEKRADPNVSLNITHYYEIEKKGRTPVPTAELTVFLPSHLGNDPISYDIETSDWIRVLRHISLDEDMAEHFARDWYNVTCSSTSDRCHIVKMAFLEGIPRGPSSWIKINLFLDVGAIESEIEEKVEIIVLSSTAVLKYETFFEDDSKEMKEGLNLTLFPAPKVKAFESYVVALSVLAGGFIFLMIVTWLRKKNFFKRTKKEELKALKEAETCFVYFSTRPVETSNA